MTMQPFDHGATRPVPLLPPMPGSIGMIGPKKSRPKTPPTRTEAVVAAKAKITRRNSLRKQRQALKT